jgi:hypothetical protein
MNITWSDFKLYRFANEKNTSLYSAQIQPTLEWSNLKVLHLGSLWPAH